MESFRAHYIKVAGTIALLGNAVLAAVKLLFAYLSGSLAVMGDGIDSSTDVLIAIVTLFISGMISKPSDKDHPWGHGRAETTATMMLAFIIFFAGTQLVMKSVVKLLNHNDIQSISNYAIIAAVISITGKALLAVLQYHYGKIANSDIVKANAQNMKNDIVMSAGVLAGLVLSDIFNCPVLDPVIALAVGLWVIKNASSLFNQTNTELMDGNVDNILYRKLFHAAISVEGVSNPHKARIRKIANLIDIDLDIEVHPDITVYEAHELAERVEEAVRNEIPEVYDIVIHIEPEGSDSHQPKERFGLTPHQLEQKN
ncbi:MAG: cation diffusion facilitator family transporter [Treponema sp.]|nr:cation diffusion facilitator family transporter [Treponema sp.]